MAHLSGQLASLFARTPQAVLLAIAVLASAAFAACSLPAFPPGGVRDAGSDTKRDVPSAYLDVPTAYPDVPTVIPDGPVVFPDGPVVLPDGSVVRPDGPVVLPDGPAVIPDGLAVTPDGRAVTPDGPVVLPDGPAVIPDGRAVTPDDPVVRPDGPVILPDGSVVLPDGPVVTPDGPAVIADGATAPPDISLAAPVDTSAAPDVPPSPDSVPDVGPVRPANLSIKRESDTTRQVRLSWEYPSAVDIYIQNGDANGYYVESFSGGATVMPNITGGTWLDADAPSYPARYYRVRAVDSGQWAIDTAMKWDFGPFTQYRDCGFPLDPGNGGYLLSKFVGAQMVAGSDFLRWNTANQYYDGSTYSNGAWTTDFNLSSDEGFLLRPQYPSSATVTIVGNVPWSQKSVDVVASGYTMWSTQYPNPMALSAIPFIDSGAHAGTSSDNADVVEFFNTATQAWQDCWLSTDGHWYWSVGGAVCDGTQLRPGRGFLYKNQGAAFTFTIPKPYSNP